MFSIWLFNIAMENGPFIDDFPIKTSIYKGFSMAMLNNQMVQHLVFPGVGSIPIFPICESAKQMFSSANQLGRGLSIHGHVLDAWEIQLADVQELTYKNCKTRRYGGRSICKKCTRQDNQIIPSRSLLTPQRLSAFDCFMAGGQRRLFSAAPGVWWVSVWLKSFRVSMPWRLTSLCPSIPTSWCYCLTEDPAGHCYIAAVQNFATPT